MKKLLIACSLLFSAAVIHASGSNAKQLSDASATNRVSLNDTVPSDTTKPDSLYRLQTYNNVRDTTPPDTTKPDSLFAANF